MSPGLEYHNKARPPRYQDLSSGQGCSDLSLRGGSIALQDGCCPSVSQQLCSEHGPLMRQVTYDIGQSLQTQLYGKKESMVKVECV